MELVRALALLVEPPGPGQARTAALLDLEPPDEAAYTAAFVLGLAPYASIHLGPEGMLGGEARDRVAGFCRALGWTPPAEPDHLATLLALYATLAERAGAGAAAADSARSALLAEHLLAWVPGFTAALRDTAPAPYPAWAALLDETLAAEAARTPPPALLPLHLREAPALPDPRVEGTEAFIDGLLAPVRSGWVVTRATLLRAAGDLGLGLRAGERRYALRALLGQDPPGVLAWLAGEARRVARRAWDPWAGVAGPTPAFWLGRAQAGADLLDALATEAADRLPGG